MAGKSRITADEEQRKGLQGLARSPDRGEADRARAILLTLSGWTSPRVAEAFGVREDTVRLWRSAFANGGVEELKATVAPGPTPVKSAAALRVAMPLLEEPVADRRNWTIPRLRAESEAREGVRISRSQLSKALRKKVPLTATAAHTEGTPERQRGGAGRPSPATAQTAGGSGRHRSSLRRRERGLDASLPRPRLGKVGSRSARPGAGTGQEGRDAGIARSCHPPTHRPHQSDQAQQRFRRPSEQLDRLYGPKPGQPTKPAVLVEDNGPIHTSKISPAALAAPSMPRNSTISSQSGATSRRINSPIRPSSTPMNSNAQSIKRWMR